jgi:hypothetical protein
VRRFTGFLLWKLAHHYCSYRYTFTSRRHYHRAPTVTNHHLPLHRQPAVCRSWVTSTGLGRLVPKIHVYPRPAVSLHTTPCKHRDTTSGFYFISFFFFLLIFVVETKCFIDSYIVYHITYLLTYICVHKKILFFFHTFILYYVCRYICLSRVVIKRE